MAAVNPAGEEQTGRLRLQFDRSVKLAFCGSSISSDGGLLLHRELDDALCLIDLAYNKLDVGAGMAALDAFEVGEWGRKYPAIAQSWRRAWVEFIAFYGFAEEVGRIVFTTNAIEALNAKLRRAVRAPGHFPGDDATTKLLFWS